MTGHEVTNPLDIAHRMPTTACEWRMAPIEGVVVPCIRPRDHAGAHEGRWHQATVAWFAGDRREFVGAYPGRCAAEWLRGLRCPLPAGHPGRHTT